MLRDKSILENFNLVEELDDESAMSYNSNLLILSGDEEILVYEALV